MKLDVVADTHCDARPRIDAVNPGLGAAPDPEAGREIAIDGSGHPEAAIDEQVATVEADNAALDVAVERKPPRQRLAIDAAFNKQRERVASAAIFPNRLPPFGRDPDWNADER